MSLCLHWIRLCCYAPLVELSLISNGISARHVGRNFFRLSIYFILLYICLVCTFAFIVLSISVKCTNFHSFFLFVLFSRYNVAHLAVRDSVELVSDSVNLKMNW